MFNRRPMVTKKISPRAPRAASATSDVTAKTPQRADPAKKKTLRAGHATRRPHRTPPLADTTSEEVTADGQFVVALARGLEVLRAFRPGEAQMGNNELAKRTGLPKPTVSRLTHTLTKLGFLSFSAKTMSYELGAGALSLGYVALSNIDVRRCARPLMQSLANDSGFNVGLGMRDQHMMIYTDACEGTGLVGLTLRPGSRIPIATTAMGRAYLAGLPEDEREALLQELAQQYDAEWPALLREIRRANKEVETRGFCTSLGDWQKDIYGVAAPIRMPSGQRCYSLNLGGPKYLLSAEQIMIELGPRVATLAREIEQGVDPTSAV